MGCLINSLRNPFHKLSQLPLLFLAILDSPSFINTSIINGRTAAARTDSANHRTQTVLKSPPPNLQSLVLANARQPQLDQQNKTLKFVNLKHFIGYLFHSLTNLEN
jgi:hypothetical protein